MNSRLTASTEVATVGENLATNSPTAPVMPTPPGTAVVPGCLYPYLGTFTSTGFVTLLFAFVSSAGTETEKPSRPFTVGENGAKLTVACPPHCASAAIVWVSENDSAPVMLSCTGTFDLALPWF